MGARHEYPLSLVRSGEQVRQGVVVMGNAAHALHPVAGQGFNLALRDVAELGRVLARGAELGLPPGDLAMLQRYHQRQRTDQDRTIHFSDRVPSLFMNRDPVLGIGRDLALAGLDILPGLKREFVRYARVSRGESRPVADAREFDVVIVGAGIAGGALAVALSGEGLSVALVEAQPLDPARVARRTGPAVHSIRASPH